MNLERHLHLLLSFAMQTNVIFPSWEVVRHNMHFGFFPGPYLILCTVNKFCTGLSLSVHHCHKTNRRKHCNKKCFSSRSYKKGTYRVRLHETLNVH